MRLHSGTPLFEHILGDRLVEGFLDERRDFGSSRAKREFVHMSFDEGSLWNPNVGLIVLILCFCLFHFTSVNFVLPLFNCVFTLFNQNPPCFCFTAVRIEPTVNSLGNDSGYIILQIFLLIWLFWEITANLFQLPLSMFDCLVICFWFKKNGNRTNKVFMRKRETTI